MTSLDLGLPSVSAGCSDALACSPPPPQPSPQGRHPDPGLVLGPPAPVLELRGGWAGSGASGMVHLGGRALASSYNLLHAPRSLPGGEGGEGGQSDACACFSAGLRAGETVSHLQVWAEGGGAWSKFRLCGPSISRLKI